MRIKLGDESNTAAEALLPPAKPDNSGVGINHADVVLKALGATLDDGRKIACKRRGLKITLSIGDKKGEALLRRWDGERDPRAILRRALETAAQGAGAKMTAEAGALYLEID